MIVLLIFGGLAALVTLWLVGHIVVEVVLCLVVWYKYKRSLEK